jgi:RNA polymerase sigma factor (sigma-70 family)
MKTQINFRNIQPASHHSLEQTVNELAQRRVERYLARRLDPDTIELHVHLEKSEHRDYYQVSLQLFVPDATLTSREEDWDLNVALRKAFDELEREVLKYTGRLKHDAVWRRKELGEVWPRLNKAVAAQPLGAEAFNGLAQALLPKLKRHVRRELSALRARGDLDPDYPTPQDIIDEVVARAYQRLDQKPPNLEPLHWLYQITHEVLNDEVRQGRREIARFVSTEAKPVLPRDYSVDEVDQGVREVWQPDEMLKIEDVTPVSDQTPEAELSEEEMRNYFHDALATMPANWRRAVWLTQAEGIPVAAVAAMLHASEAQVKRWIQQADEYLRARLDEAGYKPAEEGKLPSYFVPVPAAATPELAETLGRVTRATA